MRLILYTSNPTTEGIYISRNSQIILKRGKSCINYTKSIRTPAYRQYRELIDRLKKRDGNETDFEDTTETTPS